MLRNNGRHNFRSPLIAKDPQPSLVLDFAGTGTLDSRVTFIRSTTGTYYNSSGVLTTAAINAPRFDYNPSTLAPLGLLIEQSSTNLLNYSQDFSNVIWVKGGSSTITANATTAPDNTATAGLWTSTNNAGSLLFSPINSYAQAGTYTISIYYKNNTGTFLNIYCSDTGSNYSAAWVNLSTNTVAVTSNGSFSGASGTVTASSNGFYKLNLTFTKPITANSQITIGNLVTASNSFTKYVGSIYLWGAQLEALAFPTSYIPTTSAQVTRAADNATMTGTNFSSWYTQGQGTIYCEGNAFALNGSSGNPMTFIGISDNTINNEIRLSANLTSGGIFESATSGVSQFALGTAVTPKIFTKMAGSYILNNTLFSQAGGAAVTDTSCTIPTVSQMEIGNLISGRELSGWVKNISYYPTNLSSAQLQALTT